MSYEEVPYPAPVPGHGDLCTLWQAVGVVTQRRDTTVGEATNYLVLTPASLGVDVHDLSDLVVQAVDERGTRPHRR